MWSPRSRRLGRPDDHAASFYIQREHEDDSSAFYLNTPGLGLFDQDKEIPESGFDTFSLASLNIHKGCFAVLTLVTGFFASAATTARKTGPSSTAPPSSPFLSRRRRPYPFIPT